MARVFVSHAGEDRALAGRLHRWLVAAGHEVFMAQDLRDGIVVGELWEQRLHEELRRADAVLCVLTSAALASQWCTAEAAIAWSRGIRLLPLRAEAGVSNPLLQSVQHTDYTTDPDAARDALIEALQQLDARIEAARRAEATWPGERSPFPGLRPFEADQHQVFFGRTEQIGQLVELLRSPAERAEGAVLLMVGPSGCGKSSLVRAGLVPVMATEPGWATLPPFVPGSDPVGALARELAAAARHCGLDWTLSWVRDQLSDRGLAELVDELLVATPGGRRRRLLIVVDQFEELLTQTTPDEQARFAALLRPALTGPVQLIGTLRPEFLHQLLINPELAGLPTHTCTLRPLRREALRAVIENPARLAGIDLDDGLVDRLVDDTDNGEALPLLAFTLAQLAEPVTRGGRLSHARYDQLGGVRGALTRQADTALAEATTTSGRTREQVIAGLLRLVTVDEQGHPTRWRTHRDDLPDPVRTELNPFITRRLLTTDTDHEAVIIGVAHEAFLTSWPPLAEAITHNVTALRARRAIEHAATEWHNTTRPPSRLWEGGQLAAAITDTGARISRFPSEQRNRTPWLPWRSRVLITDRVDLTPIARDFLRTSIRYDRNRRRRSTTTLSVLLILALVAAGVALYQRRDAQQQQRTAIAGQLVTQADAIRETDPHTALLLGIAAERIRPGGDTQRASLVTTLTTTPYAGTLAAHTSPVTAVAFAPDGHTLATGDADGAVILWNVADPARPWHHLTGRSEAAHTDAVTSMAFAPDSHTLVTGSFDGTVIWWDLTDPVLPARSLAFPIGAVSVSAMAFSADARTLATGGYDATVRLWDLTDPAGLQQLGAPLIGHSNTVFSVAFAPDAHLLVTGDSAGTVSLWDLSDPARPRRSVMAHTGTVNSVAFAPDARTLATGGDDTTVRLWDLTAPSRPEPLGSALTSHTSKVTAVAFAPDGHTLSTAGDNGTTILWELNDLARPEPLGSALTLISHTGRVTAMAFAPGSLATAGSDGTVIFWDLSNPAQPPRHGKPLTGQPGPVTSVMFAADGNTMETTSSDEITISWDITDPERPHRRSSSIHSGRGNDFSLAVTQDGNTMVTAGGQGDVVLWDRTDPDHLRPLGQPLTGHHRNQVSSAAFSSDGRTLATAGSDGTVILWEVTAGGQPQPLGQPLTGHRRQVNSVAFSSDGRTLATASDDGTAILWDLTEQEQPRRLGTPLTGHTGSVAAVAFSPDADILATGGDDATVILWDLRDLNLLRDNATQRSCSLTGRGLTRTEWGHFIPGLPYQNTCPDHVEEKGVS